MEDGQEIKLDAVEVANAMQRQFPKETQIVIMTLQNRKLQEQIDQLTEDKESDDE